MGARAVALIAAALSACWALYNFVTLAQSGAFWMPGNRIGGIGRWETVADAPGWLPVFVMAIYCLVPLFFLVLANRQKA